uniref:WAP domain-containing protein n=1 Tax=Cyprinus carpio TaxID=7962 RepID=A0A8C1S3U4_CYPCA
MSLIAFEIPGVCPGNNVKEAMLGECVFFCSHDSDCPNDQKCCSNACGHQCIIIYMSQTLFIK